MSAGLLLAILGVLLVVWSSRVTANRIKQTFGTIDSHTTKLSEGTGVVPAWISLVGLVGYLAGLAGLVIVVIGLLS